MKHCQSKALFSILFLLFFPFVNIAPVIANDKPEQISGILVAIEDDEEVTQESEPQTAPANAPFKSSFNFALTPIFSDITGNVNAKGMDLNIGHDTGLSNQIRTQAKAIWQFSSNSELRFNYLCLDQSSILNRAITFDNLNFNANGKFKIKTDLYDIGISYNLCKNNSQILAEQLIWKILAGTKIERFKIGIEENSAKASQAGELSLNHTLLYLGLEAVSRLSAKSTLHGSMKHLALNKKGEATRLSELETNLRFHLNPDIVGNEASLNLLIGYQYLLFHARANNNSSEIVLSGLVFGIESCF